MDFESLICEKNAGVGIITLNRPEVRNALSPELISELLLALGLVKDDPDIRVVILRGAGDKAFCAGGDLARMRENSAEGAMVMRQFVSHFANLMLALDEVGKPTIAAVHGYAMAGGCGLAAACDLTIASEDAVFAVPEIDVGLWGATISVPLTRLIGSKRTMELFYTGRRVDAPEAERIGLVNRVIPRDRLDAEVSALAEAIARKSPLAIKMGREAFGIARDMEYTKSIKYLREMMAILGSSHDAREGMNAFLEKREPNWQGR